MKPSKRFSALLQKGTHKGAWTFVVWPRRSILRDEGARQSEGHRGRSSLRELVHGDGKRAAHAPIKADVREAIGKEAGRRVTVVLTEWD